MTLEQIARAVWHQNSPSTVILKCCVKDGSAVLARIYKLSHFKWEWHTESHVGGAKTRHTAMRHARKTLRTELEDAERSRLNDEYFKAHGEYPF